MSTSRTDALCQHCEQKPAVSKLGLCRLCQDTKGIRLLYRRNRNWNAERERQIMQLRQLANQRLPMS